MTYSKGKLIRDGGEGWIYEVVGYPNLLIKIYKDNDVGGDPIITPILQRKLEYMKNHQPSNIISLGQISWPIELIYENGYFLGFVMPRLSFDYRIQEIYGYKHPLLDQTEYESYPAFISRVGVAINLCSILNELHIAGYVVGDLNHENIGVNSKTGAVNIVDCDSFHITDGNGQILRTNAIMPGYLAPEVIKHCNTARANGRPHNLNEVDLPTFSKETDLFCLAIHIFKLLMNGVDPFRGVNVNVTGSNASPFIGNEAIERNAYVFKEGNRPSALFCPPENTLPSEIITLLNRAFIDGKDNPFLRPSAEEWYHALYKFYAELSPCMENEKHQYHNHLYECPLCKSDKDYLAGQDPKSVEISTKSLNTVPEALGSLFQESNTWQNTYQQTPPEPSKKKWWLFVAVAVALIFIIYVIINHNRTEISYIPQQTNTPTQQSEPPTQQTEQPSTRQAYQPQPPVRSSTESEIEDQTDSDYVLPFSSTRALTDSDLQRLTKDELRIARNEIYARHGRRFKDESLQTYFDSKVWYQQLSKLPLGTEPQLSSLELSNAEFIKKYE